METKMSQVHEKDTYKLEVTMNGYTFVSIVEFNDYDSAYTNGQKLKEMFGVPCVEVYKQKRYYSLVK